jgi:hypothetical protein
LLSLVAVVGPPRRHGGYSERPRLRERSKALAPPGEGQRPRSREQRLPYRSGRPLACDKAALSVRSRRPAFDRHSRESGNLFPIKELRDPRFRGDDGWGNCEKVSLARRQHPTALSRSDDPIWPHTIELMKGSSSRARCDAKYRGADTGSGPHPAIDPGSAAHHFVLRCARDDEGGKSPIRSSLASFHPGPADGEGPPRRRARH